jgi:hypothetical protein
MDSGEVSSTFVYWMLSGFGLALLAFGIFRFQTVIEKLAFAPAEAEITRLSSIGTVVHGGGPESSSEYRSHFTITYAFTAEGRPFLAEKPYGFSEDSDGDDRKSREWQEGHQVGSSLPIYFQPGNPQVSEARVVELTDELVEVPMGIWAVAQGLALLSFDLQRYAHLGIGIAIFISAVIVWSELAGKIQKLYYP